MRIIPELGGVQIEGGILFGTHCTPFANYGVIGIHYFHVLDLLLMKHKDFSDFTFRNLKLVIFYLRVVVQSMGGIRIYLLTKKIQ